MSQEPLYDKAKGYCESHFAMLCETSSVVAMETVTGVNTSCTSINSTQEDQTCVLSSKMLIRFETVNPS